MNKIFCKILLYIAFVFGSLFSFFNFYMNGFCQAQPDIILDQSELSVINGGLDKAKNYGLSSNGANLFTIPIWTTEVLNPYLYDTFGWDTDDVANFVLQPVEDTLTGEAFNGQYAWGIIDPIYDNANTIASAIENGYRFVETKLTEVGSLARVLGANAKAFVVGQVIPSIDDSPDVLANLGENMLLKLGSDFAQIWASVNSNLTNNGYIYNSSTSNAVYYSSFFMTTFNDFHNASGYYLNLSASFSFPENIFYYSTGNHLYIVFPEYLLDGNNISCTGSRSHDYYRSNIADIQTYSDSYSYIVVSGKSLLGTFDNINWYSGYINGNSNVVNGFTNWKLPAFSSLSDIQNYLNNNPLKNATSVDYVDENGDPFDLQSLLDDLNGKYVTTDQLGQIKILIDDNPIVADSTGARQIFTDDSVQDLIDKINEILNQQDDLADELGQLNDDPFPDPDPDPLPDNPFTENTEYIPEWTIDFVSGLLPDEMFSMFKPVFDIVGENNSMHSTFILIPAILVVAFAIYIVVSVL